MVTAGEVTSRMYHKVALGALSGLTAPDPHELVKAEEFKHYLLCTELTFRAAIERKESSQYHYREEYPYTDNGDWLKLIVFKAMENDIMVRHESIPVDQWPVKPKYLAKSSHPIQVFAED